MRYEVTLYTLLYLRLSARNVVEIVRLRRVLDHLRSLKQRVQAAVEYSACGSSSP